MAGSLPGIPLSQQFDASGRLLRGCALYIYAANTTTPQTAFQDSGLTIPHPWPVPADGAGRLPMFYLADGAVHVRLLDATGISQFDYPSMLVIGPSSGGGGGGGVDPTTIFQTGDCIWLDQSGLRSGWVRDNGRTIGNATSGGSERAAADAQALFIFIWQTYTQPSANAVCPVIGGLGANALADFNAGKQITLPDKRGYSPGGLTDMGNADSGRLAGVPFTQGSATAAGSLCGEALHRLLIAEMPSHSHGTERPSNTNQTATTGGNPNYWQGQTGAPTGTAGSDGQHNNQQLTVLGTFYRKL